MPYLKIQSNQSPENEEKLLSAASRLVAEELNKPESYVMVALEPPAALSMGGSQGPAAYLELKSIGLPQTETDSLSESLCSFINQQLQIPEDRIYIKFVDSAPAMWGWKGSTF